MSIKTLLGLDGFLLTEAQIMAQFKKAFNEGQDFVEFSSKVGRIKVRIRGVNPKGIMKGYQDYYGHGKWFLRDGFQPVQDGFQPKGFY